MIAIQQRERRKGERERRKGREGKGRREERQGRGGGGRERRKGRREGRQGRGYILYTESALNYLHTILPLAKVKDIATNSGEFILCISQPDEIKTIHTRNFAHTHVQVRGTSASHRPRMAKTTSVDARRGSNADHHPRKAKPKELGNTKETMSDVKEEEGELEAGQTEKTEDEPEVKVDDQEINDAHSEG